MGPNVYWRPNIFGDLLFLGNIFFDICEGMKEDLEERNEGRKILKKDLRQILGTFCQFEFEGSSHPFAPAVWITGSARSAGAQGILRLKAGSGRSEERGHLI